MVKKRNLKKALAAVLAMTMCLSCGITGVAADSGPKEETIYSVTLEDSEYGTLSFRDNDDRVMDFSEGDKVELTVAANEGYVPNGITITDEDGQAVDEIMGTDDTEFSFNMPAANLKVTPAFAEKTSDNKIADQEVSDENAPQFDMSMFSEKELEKLTEQAEENIGTYESSSTDFSPIQTFSLSNGQPDKTAYIVEGEQINYGGWFTHRFTADGQTAYCAEPNVNSPGTGTLTAYEIDNNPLLRTAILCAPGGPLDGKIDGFPHGSIYYDENPSVVDGNRYQNAHAAIAYIYTGDLTGLSSSYSQGIRNMVQLVQNVANNTGNGYGSGYGVDDLSKYTCYIAINGLQDIVWCEESPTGFAQLQKSSANTSITDGNGCYTLEGAQYGVYSDSACANQVATLTTDAAGNSNTVELDAGTYYVKETKAPTGYATDGNTYTINVQSNQTSVLKVSDQPTNDPAAIEIIKIDQETGDMTTQGAASLAGAQFTINFYAGYYDKDTLPEEPTRTWVIETKAATYNDGSIHYITGLANEYKVSGDEFYYVGNNNPVLPLGTVTIEETKAPNGYNLDGAYLQADGSEEIIEGVYVAQIRQQGDMARLQGGNEYSMSDRVIRGDFEFTKKDEENKEAMANIPFEITSNTTGETHKIMTDENGYYSSASSFNPHTQDTNGGKATSGLWFGLNADGENVEVNDEYGALPYDTYTIEELECEANADKNLFKGTLTVSREGFTIDMGTIENPDLFIQTTAKDEESGNHYSLADEEVTIIDEVSYVGLDRGEEYRLVGTIMNKGTNSAVLDKDGNPITSEITFTPKTAEGTEEVEFTFDATDLAGTDVVVFEDLYLGSELVTSHRDINDDGQTIHFPEIGTKAIDSETETNVTKADKEIVLKDTVEYHNLPIGKKFVLEGTLMDKETGEPIKDANGDLVTAETTFTPETSDGIVEVEFKFDGSNLAGQTIVVFEELSRGDKTYAVHTDINSEEQTSYIPKIGTMALDDETGIQNSYADGQITIVDTVEYENLIPGKTYIMTGELIDKATGEVVEARIGTIQDAVTEIPDGAQAVTIPAGESVYIAEGNDSVAPGFYVKGDDGYTAVGSEDVTEIPEELISWSGSYAKDMEGYILDGELHVNEAPKAEMSEDKEKVTAKTTFVPEEANGTVEVTFIFDGTGMEGKTFVVYEDLLMDIGKEEPVSVAEHKDIDDEGQTIYVPEIGTKAEDSETGTHDSMADKEVTIVDHVSYENLIPGKEYEVSGVLMDKETGEALLIDGKEVTAETTFIPEKPSGTVDITFTFDGSVLAGKTIVASETVTYEGRTVAVHADIEDKDQTIYFPEIGTRASDKADGDKQVTAQKNVTITDEVTFKNLTPGTTYKVVGTLMDKSTGKALLINGKEVTAEKEFTPDKATGTVSLDFTFDGTGLGGKDLVVFEKIYTTDTNIEVANHEDIDDEGQTVTMVTPPKGTVQTGDNRTMYAFAGIGIVLLVAAGGAFGYSRKKK
uniref:VaFE repeat-containing surface-anchored protein n=1 Tax=Lachnoclostridium phocaeense TaxID=1871021 RepID=UPI0026DCEEAD|nr:VaFE repeat-containing surface-anchored protein [Lachnoclostridium phocaeense]